MRIADGGRARRRRRRRRARAALHAVHAAAQAAARRRRGRRDRQHRAPRAGRLLAPGALLRARQLAPRGRDRADAARQVLPRPRLARPPRRPAVHGGRPRSAACEHFRPEQRPAGAGDRCLDCAIEPDCPYSARRIYLGMARARRDRLARRGARLAADRRRTSSGRCATGPYGRCVWACDNDVVDHQVVSLRYEGGATATLHDDRVHAHARARDAHLRHARRAVRRRRGGRRLRLPQRRDDAARGRRDGGRRDPVRPRRRRRRRHGGVRRGGRGGRSARSCRRRRPRRSRRTGSRSRAEAARREGRVVALGRPHELGRPPGARRYPPPAARPAGRPLARGGRACPACTALGATASCPDGAPRGAGRSPGATCRSGCSGAAGRRRSGSRTTSRSTARSRSSRAREGAAGAAARERMRREARLMARLGDHPHIVTVYDAVEDGGRPAHRRALHGRRLARRAARGAPGGRLPVAEVLRTGRALADALAHAHAHGVVHRDVKPDNVWLDADGDAGLGDFGIAVAAGDPAAGGGRGDRHARTTRRPSRPRARAPLPQSDLYALGATLWELLCGRPAVHRPERGRAARPAPATPRPSRRRATRRASRPSSTRSCSRCSPSARRPPRATPPRSATRSTGSAARRASRSPPSPPTASRSSAATRSWRACGPRSDRARGRQRAVVARRRRAGDRQDAARRRGRGRGAAPRGAAVVRGRAGEESRAYGPWRGALRPLVAAASGLSAPVLDELRRLTGDGRVPELAARRARRRGGAAADVRRGRRAGPGGRRASACCSSRWRTSTPPTARRSRCSATCWRAAPDARLLLVAHLPQRRGARPAIRSRRVLDALERDRRLTRVTLHGLPEAAVARFLPPGAAVAPAALRSLHERTAGNPFFLRELVRLLAERGALGGDGAELPALVPERVREVVGRAAGAARAGHARGARDRRRRRARRSRSPASRGSAGSAARPSPRRSSPRWPGGSSRRARTRPGRFGFAHAIVRDAVYDELSPRVRARLHASVAAVLQESLDAGGEATAAEAAHHALAAARCGADPQPAWELSLEAAREAAALQAHAEAAAHYAGALEALELGAEASAAERLDTTLALAAAAFAAGDIEAARRRFRAVAAAARRAAPPRSTRAPRSASRRSSTTARSTTTRSRCSQGALDALPRRRQRAARAGDGAARPAARSRDRPGPARGAARRGRRDGAPARRSRRARVAARRPPRWSTGRPSAPPCARGGDRRGARPGRRAAPTWRRSGGRARCGCATRSRPASSTAVDAELDRARPARGREPPDLLPLVPARAPGRARDLRRPARRGRAARGGGGRAQPPPRRRRRPGAHGAAPRARAARRRPHDAPLAALRDYAARYPGAAGLGGDARPGRARAALRRGRSAPSRRSPGTASPRSCARPTGSARSRCWPSRSPRTAGPSAIAALAAALAPHAERNAVMDDAWAAFGPVARPLGVLAAAAGRPRRGRRALRARGAARGALGRARPGSSRRSPTGCGRGRAGARRGRAAARALALARDLELPWVAAAAAVRPRRRRSPRSPAPGTPPSRPRSRRRPSPRPSCSARGSRPARSRRARRRG